ncbi:hypothetical protein NDU88_004170 [Pleurodeles waltl]|uniref:Uncharacterized protein n=1 Tax=Pleurodeles waltl TaxID=8319 RepID=A0AAV7RHC1_PLEWA|nr:hypothetical protein NDU88_004170 [Pleurodeles waltl]
MGKGARTRSEELGEPPGVTVAERELSETTTAVIVASNRLNKSERRLKVLEARAREVQQQRAAFSTVKKKLRDLGVEYSMQFPAWLQVITPAGVQFFLTPQEAWSWAECQPGPGPSGERHAGKGKHRARSQRRRGSIVRESPTAEEVQHEKLKAVKEVVSISGKKPGGRVLPLPSINTHKFRLGQ